jgi:hypothetical protein
VTYFEINLIINLTLGSSNPNHWSSLRAVEQEFGVSLRRTDILERLMTWNSNGPGIEEKKKDVPSYMFITA